MTKRIKLSERSDDGRIIKNESYQFEELEMLVIKMNKAFYHHPLWGKQRRKGLVKAFNTFQNLVDLDAPGRHRVRLRK